MPTCRTEMIFTSNLRYILCKSWLYSNQTCACNKTVMQKCCRNIQFQRFFLGSCNKLFLDSETVFSILKYFSRFRNFFSIPFFLGFFWLWDIFVDSKFFFLILKVFSWLWKFFLNLENFFSMAAIGHHKIEIARRN